MRSLWIACFLASLALAAACGPATPNTQNPTNTGDPNDPTAASVEPLSGPITKLVLKGASQTPDWVEDITASVDGKHLLIVTRDGSLWRWTPTEGKAEKLSTLGEERERTSMRPGGLLALSIGGDAPRVFDATNGHELMRFAAWKGAREAVWSPAGKHFILVNQDGTLALWDVDEQLTGFKEGEKLEDFLNRQEPKHQIEMESKIQHVALTADGRMAVAVNDSGKKGTLYIGDIAKLDQMAFLGRTNGDVSQISLSPDAKYLATVNDDNSLRLVSTSKQGFVPWTNAIPAKAISWTPRNTLAVIEASGQVRMYERDDGKAHWMSPGPFSWCVPAKNWFACTDGRSIQLLDPQSGTNHARLATWGESYLIYTSTGHHTGNVNAADWLEAEDNGKPVSAAQWNTLKNPEKVKVQAPY